MVWIFTLFSASVLQRPFCTEDQHQKVISSKRKLELQISMNYLYLTRHHVARDRWHLIKQRSEEEGSGWRYLPFLFLHINPYREPVEHWNASFADTGLNCVLTTSNEGWACSRAQGAQAEIQITLLLLLMKCLPFTGKSFHKLHRCIVTSRSGKNVRQKPRNTSARRKKRKTWYKTIIPDQPNTSAQRGRDTDSDALESQ